MVCASIDIIFGEGDIILFVAIAIENNDSTNSNKHTKPCFLADILTLFKTNDGIYKTLYNYPKYYMEEKSLKQLKLKF
jgi:hypothetical protein